MNEQLTNGNLRAERGELTPFAYQCVIDAIDAAHKVQIQKMSLDAGLNLRSPIEIAAAFLAYLMDHAYAAAVANSGDPGEFADLLQLCTADTHGSARDARPDPDMRCT